jgi:hypothetical protein
LKTYDQSDPFLRQDFNDNSSKLDAYPGAYICTSQSRPAWGPAQAGMRIFETDTRRELMWTGTAWREPLSAPPVFSGSIRPNATLGLDTHVYYKIVTFNLNRPATLLVGLDVEVQCQSIYTMNATFRVQIDGSDALLGDNGSYTRMTQIQASGGGWSRSVMIPVHGIRALSAGSHNFGIHMYTTPTSTTKTGSMRLTSARGWGLAVNSTDT